MKIIGITGGVGSGKSKVLECLEQEFGAKVYQADEIAKGIYADYAPLLRELRDLLIIRKNETENKDLF